MTIKDLAAMTGYAVGTVSRVLNNHPNVSEKARTAILAAVEESGFQLNVNAKQLKQSHGNSILVILKGSGNILFAEMLESAARPADIIKAKGMEQVSDMGAIEALVEQVIAENPKAVEDFKGGKTNVLGWLTGQVMKKSAGKANPATATALVKEKLSAL